jgi:predicted hydrocarbon binding protein/predicted Ser/Thr protein kinase
MHGLIFLQLQKFAQKRAGPQAWEALLREANLSNKSYSPAKAYSDEDLLAIVGATSRVLDLPTAAVVEAFGEFLGPELLKLYTQILKPEWKTLDVLEHTEKLIHTAVRVGNPGAHPPVLDAVRTREDEVQLVYSSERKMCHLVKGIISGLGHHFGEEVSVTHEACMLSGDPFCSMRVTRSATARDTRAHSFDTVTCEPQAGSAYQFMEGTTRFTFLRPPVRTGDLGLLADYRVLDVLGQGTMGVVFRAVDKRLDRLVALKVLQPQYAEDGPMRQRFLREVKAVASVRSDHVVSVYEAGVSEGFPFLAMEFLEGETLGSHHKSLGKFGWPIRRVFRIAREIALGLDAIHHKGFLHRDIKPENLWIESPSGRTKILDFGLARAREGGNRLTQTGVLVGTPAYMAPEQAAARELCPRADLFSLGSVMYFICTGMSPFKGNDVMSTLMALATHQPEPPGVITTEAPPALSDLIMLLLRKNPQERPGSAREVVDMLTAIERTLELNSL